MIVHSQPQKTLWFQNEIYQCSYCKAEFRHQGDYTPTLRGRDIVEFDCQFCGTYTYWFNPNKHFTSVEKEAVRRYQAMQNREDEIPKSAYISPDGIEILDRYGRQVAFGRDQLAFLRQVGILRKSNYDY